MKNSLIIYSALILILLSVPACYNPQGPAPEAPYPPPELQPIPQKVVVEEKMLYAPAPRENGIPPQECDYIHYLRYRPETADGAVKAVNAILVLIPGYMGGATAFDYLGRQLVSMAEQQGHGSVEVWAVDRRANCLEDLTGMNAAEAAANPALAIDYYYNNRLLDGRGFSGFLSQESLPFLSEFGLQLLMNDINAIITARLPDNADRKKAVFIGGHSLGGPLTALFAGWDFDGKPETTSDAGYNNCAGLVGLDGGIGLGSRTSLDERTYQQRLADIRSGASARISLVAGVTPEALALLEIMGIYAATAPDTESTWFKTLPYSEDVGQLIRLLTSRDVVHFISGTPSFTDFRFTNEALLGMFIDENFQPISIMKASLGFMYGGTVMRKQFPFGQPDLFPWHDSDPSEEQFIAWDAGLPTAPGSGPLYSWTNFDELGDAAHPEYQDATGTITYTFSSTEVTDIQDFARLLFTGPLNFTEWYFPARLTLDMSAAVSSFNAEYGLNFFHEDSIQHVPTREFMAEDAFGYNHLDVLCAAVDRPCRRKNEIFEKLLEFLLVNSEGTVVPGE
jgi:pimeloyl-ACP methyl ester carboxylesterase